MIHIVFLSLFALKATEAKETPAEAIETCSDINPFVVCRYDPTRLYVPSNSTLFHICERLLSYYACFHEHQNQFPTNDEGFCGIALIYKRAEPLVREVCEEGNKLHNEYLEKGSCLGTLNMELNRLWREAEIHADYYYRLTDDDEYAKKLMPCIVNIAFMRQLNLAVLNECRIAFSMYAEIVTRSGFHLLQCRSEEEYEKAQEAMSVIAHAILKWYKPIPPPGKYKKVMKYYDRMYPDGVLMML